jgi:hypothetical protein
MYARPTAIPILRQKIKLLMLLHASYVGGPSNPGLEPLLGEDAVRLSIASAATRGSFHLTQVRVDQIISFCTTDW